jgi:hypothetical protein
MRAAAETFVVIVTGRSRDVRRRVMWPSLRPLQFRRDQATRHGSPRASVLRSGPVALASVVAFLL